MLGHQRQPQHAGQRRRGGPGGGCSRRLAQACQGLGNGIQHPVGEVTGKGMQLSALGHQFGLLQRIARAIGVVQQGLFQRLDGQDQRRGQGLHAVADAEDRQATVEHFLRRGRGARQRGRFRATGQDDALGAERRDLGRVVVPRPDFAVDAQLADAAGNQLRVLRAEIEDQDLVVMDVGHGALSMQ
ncbi:hypothetical protein G6F50_013922 [Rhizopus delemar]|uniref:Uncharacterized protein n=1 Tax=Rhizopus delemar TaxID=936053 RepID=A0A9P6YBT4_9FUNG|nr:hypothetical protein G6F50_013922 [Rhizopus delemar]